jgi:phosphoribosyl 1,2-cyclic phosphate phosphodiesterase
VEVAQDVGAKKAYLTHQTHERLHTVRQAQLPAGIDVAFDGLKIEFDLAG